MEKFASHDPRSYSLYFDLNIWFRAWNYFFFVTDTGYGDFLLSSDFYEGDSER